MNWDGWSLDRVVLLFSGIIFLIIFIQVTLFHYRQNFRHWSMWIPVLATPVFGIFLILFSFYYADWLSLLVTILLTIGVVAGLFGTFMHIRGVGQRVDGYKLRNFLIGPPLTLPGLISGMSILGLLATHWG